MKPDGRAWIALVKELPCVLCTLLGQQQTSPTAAHHVREGQGGAQRADDHLTCALCHECHQGDLGFHGNRTLLRIAKVEELDLLALTIAGVHRLLAERLL